MSPHSRGHAPLVDIITTDSSSFINPLANITSAALLALRERSPSQPSPLDRLSESQSQTLRYTAIASSVILITAGLVGFYLFGAIDARRRVFRHHLIFFLIGYDFLKAVVLLFYPARVAIVNLAYYNGNFCDIVGFFTAMSIEGADIAIFSFAIHTALLIFAPNRKFKNGDKVEGGLFPYRYYVWVLSFVVPIVLASLAFINNVGYEPLTSWCYLPERPRWYRLVLSWVPRYIIVITIICIYCAIYIHVIRQFNKILYIHEELNNKKSHRLKFDRNLFINLRYIIREYLSGHIFTENTKIKQKLKPRHRSRKNNSNSNNSYELESVTDEEYQYENKGATSSSSNNNSNNDPNQLQKSLHEATMSSFEQRRIQIEKQMKSIFIYPISYIFLWLAPFALQCIQYDYELRHGPVYWLTAISAFMQPFNCTIDTIVFMYRERPWDYTVLNVTKKIKNKHGHLHANDHFARYYDTHDTWRKYVSWLPLYYLPDENFDFGKEGKLQAEESAVDNNKNVLNGQLHDFNNILGTTLNENEFRSSIPANNINTGEQEQNNENNQDKDNYGITILSEPQRQPVDSSETGPDNPFKDSSNPSSPKRHVSSPKRQKSPKKYNHQIHQDDHNNNHDHDPKQQKRSDTMISTSDFYNMPHRASSVRRSSPHFPSTGSISSVSRRRSSLLKFSQSQGNSDNAVHDSIKEGTISTHPLTIAVPSKAGFWSKVRGGKQRPALNNGLPIGDGNDAVHDTADEGSIFGSYELKEVASDKVASDKLGDDVGFNFGSYELKEVARDKVDDNANNINGDCLSGDILETPPLSAIPVDQNMSSPLTQRPVATHRPSSFIKKASSIRRKKSQLSSPGSFSESRPGMASRTSSGAVNNVKLPTTGYQHFLDNSGGQDDDDDESSINFIDFLKKGPPI